MTMQAADEKRGTVVIDCDRLALIEAIKTASQFTPQRSGNELMRHVCLDSVTSEIMAFGRDIGCRVKVQDMTANGDVSLVLHPGRMRSILCNMTGRRLFLQRNGDTVQVIGDASEHTFPWIDPSDYPVIPRLNPASYYEIPGQSFAKVVRRTTFACDQENTRYALGAVSFELHSTDGTAIATDGRRLSIAEFPLAVHGKPEPNRPLLIPGEAMTLFGSLFAGDEVVMASFGEKNAVFSGRTTTSYTTYVEGRFPRWQDCIPPDGDEDRVSVEITAGTLLPAVMEASAFSNSEYRGIDFVFSDGVLELRSIDQKDLQSSVMLSVEFKGQPTVIFLDHRYIADVLRAVDPSAKVTMRFKTGGECSTVVEVLKDDGYTYLIMPLEKY